MKVFLTQSLLENTRMAVLTYLHPGSSQENQSVSGLIFLYSSPPLAIFEWQPPFAKKSSGI